MVYDDVTYMVYDDVTYVVYDDVTLEVILINRHIIVETHSINEKTRSWFRV